MYQDYKDLLSAFHAHGVRYLIVGGYAVIFHAQPRFTKDIDVFIKADSANAQATYDALAEFGAPLEGIRGKARKSQYGTVRMAGACQSQWQANRGRLV
jgi:hypothetical protein